MIRQNVGVQDGDVMPVGSLYYRWRQCALTRQINNMLSIIKYWLGEIKYSLERRAVRSFFDRDFYLATYPDVAASNLDPLMHYIRYGAREMREPFAQFNTNTYLRLHPDAAQSQMTPLLHFVKFGRFRDAVEPQSAGSDQLKRGQDALLWRRIIEDHFDAGYYLEAYVDVREAGVDPLVHYLEFGASENRNPAPFFEASYYLEKNQDVVDCGMNPFVHYLMHGRDEGRLPSSQASGVAMSVPAVVAEAPPPPIHVNEEEAAPASWQSVIKQHFDAEYYLEAYGDVREAGVEPLGHYLEFGAFENRSPVRYFNTLYYLKNNPDVAASGMNPFVHYLMHGRDEGRLPSSQASGVAMSVPAVVAEAPPPPIHVNEEEVAPVSWQSVIKQHFDAEYYLEAYGDVREAGVEPLGHYLEFGAFENRSPVRYFNTLYYLKNNPDVAASGMNPFVHYLMHGRDEGRLPSSPILDLLALVPVAEPWQPNGGLDHKYDLSVVIPTYNRAERLPSLFESWRVTHRHTRYRYELIFSDDGSDDETVRVLEAEAAGELPITVLRNAHGGASSARNAAVAAAQGEKILFLGDDIYPEPNLINHHVEKLKNLPITAAVLGECGWHPDLDVNHLMCHITEIGCEQFSFLNLPRHNYTDFRHFYTCNISIDREFLISEPTLFDEKFYKYGFEDIELGYRLGLKGMQVFYFPNAYGDHHHSYANVAKFCFRQKCAGEMALVFEKIHPELADLIPLARWRRDAEARLAGGRASAFDFQGVLTGLCQQIEDRLSEMDEALRPLLSQAYSKLFQFCFEAGYVQAILPGFNQAIANEFLVEEFITESVKQGLDVINAVLNLDGYDAFDQAWRERPQEMPAPALDPAADTMADRRNFVIEASDMAHLASLRSAYGDFDGELVFSLKSDVRPCGLVYAPVPGCHVQRSIIAQLLLFNRANPHIDMVALSHGLHDLPHLGVLKGQEATVLTRRGPVRQGKVIRIYEGANVEAVPFNLALGDNFILSDTYGHFVVDGRVN